MMFQSGGVRSQEVATIFLFSNIYDRDYSAIYTDVLDVMFDLSDVQINKLINQDWFSVAPGSIACVVNSSRKISTFRLVKERKATSVSSEDGVLHVVTGSVVAKMPTDIDMQSLLNRYSVSHPRLPENVFIRGFNVANLGNALDELPVRTNTGMSTLGELKRAVV